jgi:hypothetical protein
LICRPIIEKIVHAAKQAVKAIVESQSAPVRPLQPFFNDRSSRSAYMTYGFMTDTLDIKQQEPSSDCASLPRLEWSNTPVTSCGEHEEFDLRHCHAAGFLELFEHESTSSVYQPPH